MKLWNPLSLSAGSDVDWNYELLKNRASDLARNSPLGQAAISTSTRGVIGSGLKLFARPNHKALGISAEEARAWVYITYGPVSPSKLSTLSHEKT